MTAPRHYKGNCLRLTFGLFSFFALTVHGFVPLHTTSTNVRHIFLKHSRSFLVLQKQEQQQQQHLQKTHFTGSLLFAVEGNDADDEDKDESKDKDFNPYADPNYPDLEFVNYDDPEYAIDTGDEYAPVSTLQDESSTEAEIEEMREERRRRNDEYQFQTFFRDILQQGAEFRGEWTVYKTSTFLDEVDDDATTGLPRLVKASEPIKVISTSNMIVDETVQSAHPTDKERICQQEKMVIPGDTENDPYAAWQKEVDTDSGFGRLLDDDDDDDSSSKTDFDDDPASKAGLNSDMENIVSQLYCPEFLKAIDFRGPQGIMCVGNSYTTAFAVPLDKSRQGDNDSSDGPFSEYRAEVGLLARQLRYRIKLDYRVKPDELSISSASPPLLHLKTLTVCREALEMWPRISSVRKNRRSGSSSSVVGGGLPTLLSEALFGPPGAQGGLYDPPPVGGEEQAKRYMLLDLEGRATVLFPYCIDQDPNAFNDNDSSNSFYRGNNGNGWVSSLDWSPGTQRYQVDRKTKGGTELLGLKTLELSEVQADTADQYRPRDGGTDMRQ